MNFNKLIFQKEIKLELRNNISLYLITPTLISLLILLPLLSQNKFFIDNDLFLILELLFLLIFSTLFSIRRNFDFKKIKRELNFAQYSFQNYFYSKLIAEIIIFSRALDDSERIAIEGYLSRKYGFKISW